MYGGKTVQCEIVIPLLLAWNANCSLLPTHGTKSYTVPNSVMFVKMVKTQLHWRLKRYDKCQGKKKKIAKSMSKDQVIPLSRKAEVTRLRKELSRRAWPCFAPVVLKQALCCENCSKPLYFLPYLSRIITVNILPIFIYIGFHLRATEFEFCSVRVQSLCYGKFIFI